MTCPISLHPFTQPVQALCSHTFDLPEIHRSLQRSTLSPVNRGRLAPQGAHAVVLRHNALMLQVAQLVSGKPLTAAVRPETVLVTVQLPQSQSATASRDVAVDLPADSSELGAIRAARAMFYRKLKYASIGLGIASGFGVGIAMTFATAHGGAPKQRLAAAPLAVVIGSIAGCFAATAPYCCTGRCRASVSLPVVSYVRCERMA